MLTPVNCSVPADAGGTAQALPVGKEVEALLDVAVVATEVVPEGAAPGIHWEYPTSWSAIFG